MDFAPLTFEKLVSTQKGAFTAKDVVVACIELFEVLDSNHNQLTLTTYLYENCSSLLGESNIIFYKAYIHIYKSTAMLSTQN